MGNATIRQSAYDFLFDFNRNYVSIFYRFRDITGYLSKVADFDPPHLHLVPPQGVTPVEFRGNLWRQETRLPGLSCGVVCVILRLAVLVEHRLVTGGQTDGHRAIASTADAQHRAVKRCSEISLIGFILMFREHKEIKIRQQFYAVFQMLFMNSLNLIILKTLFPTVQLTTLLR